MGSEVIYYGDGDPPLAIIVAAEFAGVYLDLRPCPNQDLVLITEDGTGDLIHGNYDILQRFGSAATFPNFYKPDDEYIQRQIQKFISYSFPKSPVELEKLCANIDRDLRRKSCLVGPFFSVADIVFWLAFAEAGLVWERLRKQKKFSNLVRWFNSLSMRFDAILSEVTSTYLSQCYSGKVIVCFDDTNPSYEGNEFVERLFVDMEALKPKCKNVKYASAYFKKLMEMAEKMIREGKAYVDDKPSKQIRREKKDGIHSKCRSNSCEENLKLWKEMIDGSERGMQCCLRGKMIELSPDPIYYKCNPKSHHRLGSKYKVYPTIEFAYPFIESVEGIKHALTSVENLHRYHQYHQILKDMGLRNVSRHEYSRLENVHTVLNHHKLLLFVRSGKVDGCDDPRFPTVQGIVCRGLKIEALIQLILEQGASKNSNMEWDKLWTINKKIIDRICPRHTAVIEEGRVLLTLTDGPDKPFVRSVRKHKKYERAGDKDTTFTKQIWIDHADGVLVSVDEEITLMDWGNAIVKEIEKDDNGNVTHLSGVLHLEGSVETTELKLTWLPDTSELVNLSLMLEDVEDSVDGIAALGDSNMRDLQCGDVLLLERKGYFRCDVPSDTPLQPIVLIAIPDGRHQTTFKMV